MYFIFTMTVDYWKGVVLNTFMNFEMSMVMLKNRSDKNRELGIAYITKKKGNRDKSSLFLLRCRLLLTSLALVVIKG